MSLIKSIKFVGSNLDTLNDILTQAQKHTGELRVTIEPWSEKRTLSANAQIHVWYAAIAKKDGEDVNSVANFCKLTFGLPILMTDSLNKKRIHYTLNKVGFYAWQHEQQCNFMSLLSVTSLMTTKQHSEYRDSMLAFYNKQGYSLDYMT